MFVKSELKREGHGGLATILNVKVIISFEM